MDDIQIDDVFDVVTQFGTNAALMSVVVLIAVFVFVKKAWTRSIGFKILVGVLLGAAGAPYIAQIIG